MRKLTVRDLKERIDLLASIGFGDAEVYLSTDEEGNGVRPLYEGMEPGAVGADVASAYHLEVGCVLLG